MEVRGVEGGARWRYGEWREGQDGGTGSGGRGKMEVLLIVSPVVKFGRNCGCIVRQR